MAAWRASRTTRRCSRRGRQGAGGRRACRGRAAAGSCRRWRPPPCRPPPSWRCCTRACPAPSSTPSRVRTPPYLLILLPLLNIHSNPFQTSVTPFNYKIYYKTNKIIITIAICNTANRLYMPYLLRLFASSRKVIIMISKLE